MASSVRDCSTCRWRPRLSGPLRSVDRAHALQTAPARGSGNRRLGGGATAAKQAFEEASAKLRFAGIALVSRHESAKVADAEDAIHGARELSIAINTWESRWPINTYRARDASKLSKAMLERGVQAEAMTLNDYRRRLKERDKRRATFHKLAAEFDACITLSAPGAAPVGLGWTGDSIFVVPGSMLGVPAITPPVLQDGSLPLGLQLLGFANRDAALLSIAGGVLAVLK
jgi:Asp-tRNA(Asn)/Glu-tRNA(Gln) amidotransferase A subunit family amidase